MLKTFDGNSYKRTVSNSDIAPATGFQRIRAIYSATGGETSINLSNLTPPISYIPGNNQLTVRRTSGGALISGIDYFETSTTSISFPSTDPLLALEQIEIIQEFTITGVMAATLRPDVYTSTGTAGQTLVSATFSWPYLMNPAFGQGAIRVYLNGLLQTRGVDYTEVNLSAANTNQIQFIDPLVGGENINLIPAYQVIDQSAASTTFQGQQIASIQSGVSSGFQGFVDQSNVINVPNTQITNRAPIVNLAQDLNARMGINRIVIEDIFVLPNESGPNGEPVSGVVNDTFGQIRFVGSGWTNNIDASGSRANWNGSGTTDFMEVVFYGTGLNVLGLPSGAIDNRITVDGGTESGNIYPGSSQSGILGGRGYSSGTILQAASGLTLGIHTVKLRVAGGGAAIAGIEILNNSSNVIVNPGTSYIGGQKYSLNTQSSSIYSSPVTGTNGGRVLVYHKPDGTIGTAFTPVNSSVQYLSSSSHTNETIAQTFYPRQFGAGRSDDFSTLTSTWRNAAFTLDDGITTLISPNASLFNAVSGLPEGVGLPSNSNSLTFTFIGTGLDLDLYDSANGGSDSYTFQIDGGTAQSWPYTAGSTNRRILKIVSGLPYGTHTFTFNRVTASTWATYIIGFKVYQPSKPALPSGCVALADYNVLANFTANATIGMGTISQGTLRKSCTREMIYVGTFSTMTVSAGNTIGGIANDSSTSGNSISLVFFGTGFDARYLLNTDASNNIQVSIDGSNATTANFASATFSVYGGSFSSSTGVLNQNASLNAGGGLVISGLTLGIHKVTFTNNASTTMRISCVDVITPIHSYKFNIPADFQNTLLVGSQGISDNRNLTPIKDSLPVQKAWAQAIGISGNPTTTSTSAVIIPDMSVVINTSGGPIEIFYEVTMINTTSGAYTTVGVLLDGLSAGVAALTTFNTAAASQCIPMTGSIIVPVSPGPHKVDLTWYVSGGTAQVNGNQRILKVREI